MTRIGDPTLAEQLMRTVLSLRRVVRRRVRTEMSGPPLRGAQAELLRVVEEQPGIGVAAAARELHLAGNSVSTLVNQLIDAHMLRREVDPLDRRAARLELTEEARQRLDTWRRARTGVVSGALDALSEEDTRAITDALPALEKLMAILKEQP
jgi:DNA-binding MarR family transcriptional regulator